MQFSVISRTFIVERCYSSAEMQFGVISRTFIAERCYPLAEMQSAFSTTSADSEVVHYILYMVFFSFNGISPFLGYLMLKSSL